MGFQHCACWLTDTAYWDTLMEQSHHYCNQLQLNNTGVSPLATWYEQSRGTKINVSHSWHTDCSRLLLTHILLSQWHSHVHPKSFTTHLYAITKLGPEEYALQLLCPLSVTLFFVAAPLLWSVHLVVHAYSSAAASQPPHAMLSRTLALPACQWKTSTQ